MAAFEATPGRALKISPEHGRKSDECSFHLGMCRAALSFGIETAGFGADPAPVLSWGRRPDADARPRTRDGRIDPVAASGFFLARVKSRNHQRLWHSPA